MAKENRTSQLRIDSADDIEEYIGVGGYFPLKRPYR
jgi:hypothetical protein